MSAVACGLPTAMTSWVMQMEPLPMPTRSESTCSESQINDKLVNANQVK